MNTSKRYTLFTLTAMLAVNQLDRNILGITLEAIGQEFTLSDTQLGLLSGALFAAVYVLFGFPVAKLSVKGNRRNIIGISVAIWSTLTIAMGAAQNFLQLALARLGVGIGEAGGVVPAHSIISDLYPPERRVSAMATFVVGANIGILLSFLIGGIVGQAFGWRWAFFIAGLPGLALSVLIFTTVSEPERDLTAVPLHHGKGSLFLQTIGVIWRNKALLHVMLGIGISGIVTFGTLAWSATYIIRAHGLSQGQTGVFFALTIGVIGGLGTWYSGVLADRLGSRNPKWRLGVVVVSILAAKPFMIGFLLTENTIVALGLLSVAVVYAGVFWAPTFAFLHGQISDDMRPMATAIFLFFYNIIGVGIGPTFIGFLSDTIPQTAPGQSLGYALLVVQIAGIWGAYHYYRAMRTITE
ncbi:spinster family MFS transporter [Hoeflea sp.]|uniref:spinster family MFS transporter n=1 Tax=Hoeflea sp. TaxID=1940281 RepID=UPI003A8E928F